MAHAKPSALSPMANTNVDGERPVVVSQVSEMAAAAGATPATTASMAASRR
jgi:hypothetical protein